MITRGLSENEIWKSGLQTIIPSASEAGPQSLYYPAKLSRLPPCGWVCWGPGMSIHVIIRPCPQKNLSEHRRVSACIVCLWRKKFCLKQNTNLPCMEVTSHLQAFSWVVPPATSFHYLSSFHALMMLFVYLGQLVFNWFFNKGISYSLSLWLRTIAWSHQAGQVLMGWGIRGLIKSVIQYFLVTH